MRHRNKKIILNKPADQRKALVRSLVSSLFLYGKIKTTDARAKALVSRVENLITKVRRKDDMNAIRELKKIVYTKEASIKALKYIKNLKRNSGFTRSVKVGYRAGDRALQVQVELLEN